MGSVVSEQKAGCCSINRVYIFFALFCFVYFLESTGSTYMITAIQSIEKQFQISSRMAGTLISAGDFGYIPTVAIISYLGSKGNRARWIGGGCMAIAFANFVMGMPNFVFPERPVILNDSVVKQTLQPPVYLTWPNATPEQMLSYRPLKKYMPAEIRERLLAMSMGGKSLGEDAVDRTMGMFGIEKIDYVDEDFYYNDYDDEGVTKKRRRKRANRKEMIAKADPEFTKITEQVLAGTRNVTDFFDALRARMKSGPPPGVISLVMKTVTAPIGFCNAAVNSLKFFSTVWFKAALEDLKCREDRTNLGAFLMVFCALLILGVGRTMPWSLGVPLLDDNVKRKNLPMYFAGMFFIKVLGPIVGFLIGAGCNRLYYTLNSPEGLEPADPRWIGAWWLGFLITAALLIGPATTLFFFPNPTPNEHDEPNELDPLNENNGHLNQPNQRKQSLKLVDKHLTEKDAIPKDLMGKVRDFIGSLAIVIKSPVYNGSLIGRIIDVFAFKGFFVFLPKYLESHFGLPSYKSNLYIALCYGVFGFSSGMLFGSVVMKCFKLEGRKAAAWVGAVSFVSMLISFSNVFLGCNSVVNSVGQIGLANDFNFTQSCNVNCFCDPVNLHPVCAPDGTIFFSPCHAGCESVELVDMASMKINISECACVGGGSVSRDWCQDDCGPMLVLYFGLSIVGGFVGGAGVVPAVLIVLRSVPPEHRSIALGFSGFLVSLISTLPSPIVSGYIVDTACLVWERTCDTTGSCLIYEPKKLRERIFLFMTALRAAALLFDVWVWYWAKDLKIVSEDEIEEKPDKIATSSTSNNVRTIDGTVSI